MTAENIRTIVNRINSFPGTKAAETVTASFDPGGNTCVSRILTDSRSLTDPDGTMFVAIRTTIGDGHRYIRGLYSRGVKIFMVEEMPEDAATMDATFIVVDSVRTALAALARSLTHDLACRCVLITGSRGKTTVKELLYRALLPVMDVVRSPRSWNSSIGVPLSLFEMTQAPHDCIITEAGIDGPGQAQYLVNLLGDAACGIGVITSITEEHDDAFSSHAEKIREKVRLVRDCRTIIFDASDPMTEKIIREETGTNTPELIPVRPGNHPGSTDLFHAIAYETLSALKLPESCHTTEELLSGLPSVSTRIDIVDASDGCTLLLDNFTCDLRSLSDALDFMRRRNTPAQSRTLVIGDLLHGQADKGGIHRLYRQAMRCASRFGIERLIAIGEEWDMLHNELSGFEIRDTDIFPDADSFMRKYGPESFRDSLVLVKGNPGSDFDAVRTHLENAWHDTVFEINLDAIVSNYNYYRSLVPAGTGMVAMVKASAYGMGSLEIAKTLQDAGAAYLAVAVVDEGIALRQAGITMPIIILNPITNRFRSLFAFNLEPTVFSMTELERVINEAGNYGVANYPVHIKLDTGMHRVGFLEKDIDGLCDRLCATDKVSTASVFSHLATADCLDKDNYTLGQIKLFRKMTDEMASRLPSKFKRHLLNTAGMMRFADALPYEMARLGIGLYGVSPYESAGQKHLQTVARFASSIISIKHWPTGTPIGYGCKGMTRRDSIIATVAAGYADGIDRRLGNGHTSFMVRGTECPTIGNICMDQCMIDVTDTPDAAVGDSVEIFGPDAPVEHIAGILDTIPYEPLTWVSARVKRRYFRK